MHSLRAVLSSIPLTLDETYRRILDKVSETDQPQVYRILQCVCFSKRPLRIEELATIYQLGDHTQPQFHIEDALFFPEHVLDLCSGLLLMSIVKPVDNAWEWQPWSASDMSHNLDDTVIFCTVQLSHFTVKEYFLSPRASFWHLDEQQSHIAIVQTTTMYYILATSMPNFHSLSPQDILIKHSLAAYAIKFTYRHLDSLEPREHPDLLESFRTLLNPNSALLCNQIGLFYLPVYFFTESLHVISQTHAPGLSLHVAAHLGLPQITKWLLTFDICCDQLLSPAPLQSEQPDFVLGTAAHYGWVDVVQVLLGAGADTDESIRHAMYFAASGFNDTGEVMQVLINAGGDPNATGPDGETVLCAAATYGYANIVEMLIDAGANVNIIEQQSRGSAIEVASYFCHEDVVALLIQSGANVNATSGKYGSAIQAALDGEWDHEDRENVLTLLIQSGANVNAIGGQRRSAIQAASYHGLEAAVALLIQSGADVNIRGIVHRKVRYKSGKCVEDDQGNDLVLLRYQSALSIAREEGFDGIVKMLEDAGAIDFNDLVDEVE
jgi:ankyrin repeat protein